ncbi:MAG: MATE family efflux transporter, partial [Halobacteriales archaeon]|nr:MATE family efflux transporter [Halobacteriales archaeon]
MPSIPNPVRLTIRWIGLGLARFGFVDPDRVDRTVDLAWPRIVTGLARMSKNAVDVAMVGIGVGSAAIAGVGFAGPYWGAAFTIGGGLAAGTIALVSQRYGAGKFDQLGRAVRSSVLLVVVISLPIAGLFWTIPTQLIDLLTDDVDSIRLGATYLRILAFGVPFAGLNLIGSRVLIGADDAWIPMILRGGGAVTNIVLNGIFIFGLGMGVAGAAIGTVLSNVVVTTAFAIGLVAGRLPGTGEFPVTVSPVGTYVHRETITDIVQISLPVVGRNMVWTVARFPMLAFVGLFGQNVVAAYIISRRIWGLMNAPGWGFGLAASSLVGQSLGEDDERGAEAYGRDIIQISVATYTLAAGLVFVFAEPIVRLFVGTGEAATVAIAVPLVYAACLAVIAQGVTSVAAGALDATGDTRWPFYSRTIGMFGLALPLTYLGATTALGMFGLYLAYFGQTVVPAAINYRRFSSGKWKAISRQFR